MRALLITCAVLALVAAAAVVPTLTVAPEAPSSGTSEIDLVPQPAAPGIARVDALASPPEPASARGPYVRVSRTLEVLRSAEQISAKGSEVENPCVRFEGLECVETALHPFFRALDGLAGVPGATASERVRIVTFGNSMIASDNVTDVVRTRLQERFGEGGPGIVYVDKLLYFGRRKWTGETEGGWYREYLTQHFTGNRPMARYPIGVTGGHHVSHRAGAKTRWRLDGATVAKIYWLDHASASGFRVYVDGRKIDRVVPKKTKDPTPRMLQVQTAADARTLELVTDGPRAVVYGAVLEHPVPGVVFDTIGIVAASANSYLLTDKEVFASQLRDRDPGLVIFMLGGNETRRIDRGVFTESQVRKDFSAFVDRTRAAVPGAACLTIGPLEAVWGREDKSKRYEARPYLAHVNKVQREISLAKGCAWFDFYAAMGGAGSIERFHKRGWMNDDLIHASGLGFDILGELVSDALLRAYSGERSFENPRHLMARHQRIVSGTLPPGPGLDLTTGARLRVALLGGEDPATRSLFDNLESRLAARFGPARSQLKPATCGEAKRRGKLQSRLCTSTEGSASASPAHKGGRVVFIDPAGTSALSARTGGKWRNVLRRGKPAGALLEMKLGAGDVELLWRGKDIPRVVFALQPALTGFSVDRVFTPAVVAARADWDLAVVHSVDEAERSRLVRLAQARERTICVVVGGGEVEGCALLDPVKALGPAGVAAATERGWLKDGLITEAGGAAFAELLLHELVARPSTPVAATAPEGSSAG